MSRGEQLKEEGMALFQRGSRSQAITKFEEAVQAFTAENDQLGQAEALNNIGVIYRLQRNREAATQALTQAQTIFAAIGDDNRQAQALGNLGDIYASQKKREEAARAYSEASALFAKSGDLAKQSQVLRALSLLDLKRGRWFMAMMRMEESLRVNPHPTILQRVFRRMLHFVLGMGGGSA
jgi:tetratricopeptide (TPR) repeat protein